MPTLTDTYCRNAKPSAKPTKHFDGEGLFLLVQPSGAKLWRWKYRRPGSGKENLLSAGTYPEVSLKKAREQVAEWRRLHAQGIDPSDQRKATRNATAHTFEAVAREWFEASNRTRGWAESHATKIIGRFEGHVFPLIGHRPIASLKGPDLVDLLQRIERLGLGDTVVRVRQTCSEVFRYAIGAGYGEVDPTVGLNARFQSPRREHYPSITNPAEVGQLLRAIDSCRARYVVGAALRLAPFVFLRPAELAEAEWSEIDFDNERWTIPEARMKGRVDHLVPLSRQAVAILQDIRLYTGTSRFVFPGRTIGGKEKKEHPITGEGLNAALKRIGYGSGKFTMHSFRSMASTLLNDSQKWRSDVIERQLAHTEKDKVRAAYNRALYMPERVEMMQWWADYLDELKAGANVVPLRRAAG